MDEHENALHSISVLILFVYAAPELDVSSVSSDVLLAGSVSFDAV